MLTGFAFYARWGGLAVGGALAWLMYFDLKDRLQPEPRRLLLIAFLLGALAVPLALAGYHGLEWLGAPSGPGGGVVSILLYSLLVIGPVEEGAKFLVARTLVFRWRYFDEAIDGLVYAAAISIGFATVENMIYAPWISWPHRLARIATSPLIHSLFGAVWGFATAHAMLYVRGRGARIGLQAAGLVAAMGLHGLYDFVLFAGHLTYLASALVLVIWLLTIAHARKVVRARPPAA